MVNDDLVRAIVARVVSAMDNRLENTLPVEISARHVHLSRNHVDTLFGKGYELTPTRPLSQPGQFLCKERVRIIGPSGVLANVAILGPVRGDTQAELSAGDTRILGITAPVAMSGDLSNATDVLISSGDKFVEARGAAIVARNHIHMTPEDAQAFDVRDGDTVNVRVAGQRSIVFENVPVRVADSYALAMHIDFDEANACLCGKNARGTVVSPGKARGEHNVTPVPEAPGRAMAESCTKPAFSGSLVHGQKRSRVISAETAKELVSINGPINLPKGCIITPLARDIFNAARAKVVVSESVEKERACLSAQ